MRYFQNDIRNLITASTIGTNFTQANVNRARTAGIEATLDIHPMKDLTLSFGYTWLAEAKDLTMQTRLLRRPEHTGTATLNYHFLDRFNVNTSVIVVSNRVDIDAATFATTTDKPYVKWNAGLSYEIHKNLEIFGRVENILGDRYEEVNGYPALRRIFWAGIKLKF